MQGAEKRHSRVYDFVDHPPDAGVVADIDFHGYPLLVVDVLVVFIWYNLGTKNAMDHQKQEKYFEQAIVSGRLSHAYALVGAKGAGRFEFAQKMAERLGAKSVYDLLILGEPEGLKIGEARFITQNLSLKSTGGGYKVAIIKNAEAMTHEAANALLKTLEEAPPKSVIFLLVTNFYQLLPTVASRVQRINFFEIQKEEGAGEWSQYYQILSSGQSLERLKTAEAIASWEGAQIQKFLVFAMKRWLREASPAALGRKLLNAYQDLNLNLNVKLTMDNLFI